MSAALLAAACTAGTTSSIDGGPLPCTPGAGGAQGAACACDEACAASAPICARDLVAEPGSDSYCTVGCASTADCPAGHECASGERSFCARCANEEPGLVPLAEACVCQSDCAPGPGGERVECRDGSCRVPACLLGDPSTCPEGFGCEEGPGLSTFCAECAAPGELPGAEGESCGCTAECLPDLVCRRGACRRPCAIDEQCGSLSCVHRTTGTPSCEEPILDCVADGSRRPGDRCNCNADCGADAPFCLLGSIAGVVVDRCAVECNPDASDCPFGTRCCRGDGVLSPTCLPDDVIDAIGSAITCSA